MENLAETLAPKHLIDLPDTEAEIKEEIAAQVVPEKKREADRDSDPRNEEQYTFALKYRDAQRKLWEGSFTTKILSLGDRQLMGVLRARYQGGTALEALDVSTAELNMQLAHLSYSLTAYPKWSESLRELKDPGIVNAIYQEVASHEAFFLGWGEIEAAGKKES